MKIRINGSVFGIAIAAFGAAFGCADDSGQSSGGDAGIGTDAASDGTSVGSSTGGTTSRAVTSNSSTGRDSTPTTTGTQTETCEQEVRIVCEDEDRVEIDPCNPGPSLVLEECDGACEQGSCVDCAPRGVVCEDGDVYPIDSCGQLGTMLSECTNGCSQGACVAEECVPSDDKQCVGSLLYALNSCGDQTNVEDVCDNGCADGACIGCVDEGDTLCYEGNVYPVDSCGSTGVLLEECVTSCTVSSTDDTTAAACSDVVCESTANVECFKGDMYAIDSCGGITDEVVTDCNNGCDDDGCSPCVPVPDGVTCVDGNVYDTVGGCEAQSVPADIVKEVCTFGCLNGVCLEEEECVPAGVVCFEGSVYNVDSCEELGQLVETCGVGCESGACLPESDGGTDAGTDTEDASVSPDVDAGATNSSGGSSIAMDAALDADAGM